MTKMTKQQKKIVLIACIASIFVIAIIICAICINGLGKKQTRAEESSNNSNLIAVNGELDSQNTDITSDTSITDTTTTTSNIDVSTNSDSITSGTSQQQSVNGSTLDSNTSKNQSSSNQTNVQVLEFKLSNTDIKMTVGETFMPIVTVLPSNATDKSEIWSVSDSSIAKVDKYGNITALKAGFCTVNVCSASNPAVNVSAFVTVSDKQVQTNSNTTQQNNSSSASQTDEATSPTYINGILIANKSYALPKDYNPGFDSTTQAAFDKMQADAAKEGLNLYISSGFRSYEYQAGLYQRYADRDGYAMADTYSARAGHSEHQTGLAFDLNTIDDSFANTAEGKWVAKNCYKYGFIIRYPADKVSITGYQYEPWHLRYLGVSTATAVYNSGLCLEEYLGIDSAYKN